MNIINFKLQNEWSLWYHDLSSNNWSLDSYKLIMKVKEYNDLCFLMNQYDNVNCGMFFLMKKCNG